MRRLFLALIVVCGLALAGPSVAGDPAALKVKLETSRQLYEPGDTVEITLTNQRGAPIFLPGCGALQLEMFEALAARMKSERITVSTVGLVPQI